MRWTPEHADPMKHIDDKAVRLAKELEDMKERLRNAKGNDQLLLLKAANAKARALDRAKKDVYEYKNNKTL